MISILDKDKILALEAQAVRQESVGSFEILYEQMANAFCSQFYRQFQKHSRLLVFAGPGRTGAIALASARILSSNMDVDTFLLNPSGQLSAEVERNRDKLLGSGAYLKEFTTSFHPPVIEEDSLVIDGLYGVEAEDVLDEGMCAVIRYINHHSCCTLAIDLPSGLAVDRSVAAPDAAVIQARYTYNFHAPTLAMMMAENAQYIGQRETLFCGWSPEDFGLQGTEFIFTLSDLDENLSPRPVYSDKKDYGHVALVAGSKGMLGAALLAAKACMRTGAGLLTLHLPQGLDVPAHVYLPETLVEEDASASCFSSLPNPNRFDAIAVGPGLGKSKQTAEGLERLLRSSQKPMILDADALNLMAERPELKALLREDSILTPHKREMDRLLGGAENDFDRLQKARAFAKEYKVLIVLKGPYTATCLPTDAVIFNETGNPGMATAGCGDVLTGMILGFRAQQYDALTSAVFAVFLHGYAADRYAEERSEESLLASDVVDYIPIAFKHFKRDRQF